jgi:truncated hemoglobin YjbI
MGVSLHYEKVDMWNAVNAEQTTGPIFYAKTINSDTFVRLVVTEFFTQLTEEEELYSWFQQDSATAHTANNILAALIGVFSDRIIGRGL